ncbi:MAG: hypothetical protein NTZ52_01610 [Chlamydiae bacterium]|nr:hypothetical protein [Chlamydiota bacterium]
MAKKERCIDSLQGMLDIDKQPYDRKHPMIGRDESSKQLIKESRQPLPRKPGDVKKFDTEYERNGATSISIPSSH